MTPMAVDDLWFSSRRERGPDGKLLSPAKTKRYGRGKRWRVRYLDDGGRKVERLFERRADAERFDAGVRSDVSRGVYVDDRAGRITVEQYVGQWVSAQVWRPGAVERTERTLRLHVFPVLGALALTEVRPSHIQAWVKGLDLAPSTARIACAVMVGMFGAAVRDRLIGRTPCDGIRLPELPHAEHVIPTPVQVHALADALPDRFRATVYVAAGCGLRLGEVLGLEVAHVDFLRRELHVRQ
jgi:integrase